MFVPAIGRMNVAGRRIGPRTRSMVRVRFMTFTRRLQEVAVGRKSPHNHVQTARNLRRSLRNATAGARLIQADGLDSKSAADVAASLAEALEELHRLQRSLDRRIRRDEGRGDRSFRS
jgi:hypothetical protein